MRRNLLKSFRSHGHHIVLVFSIAALVSLAAWWAVFIRNSIRQQHLYRMNELKTDIKILSLEFSASEDRKPSLGILAVDARFEIVPVSLSGSAISIPLNPDWPELRLQVRSETLDRIERETARLNVMLIGEAGVFVFVVLVSVVFLYLFIRLERRTAEEIQFFWERTAHEVKTPITGIRAFLENLKAGIFEKEKMPEYVDLALAQVKRQEHLAENLLFGHMTKGVGKHFRCVEMDLGQFLTSYFSESTLGLTGAEIDFRFDRNLRIYGWADEKALQVILDNIADNAAKYCAPSPVLEIDLIVPKAHAIIIVRDNGPGFSPHVSDNIFHAFKRTDKELPVERNGTGMGMYISRALARKMGGDLKAFSEGKNKGTEFHIILRKAKKT